VPLSPTSSSHIPYAAGVHMALTENQSAAVKLFTVKHHDRDLIDCILYNYMRFPISGF